MTLHRRRSQHLLPAALLLLVCCSSFGCWSRLLTSAFPVVGGRKGRLPPSSALSGAITSGSGGEDSVEEGRPPSSEGDDRDDETVVAGIGRRRRLLWSTLFVPAAAAAAGQLLLSSHPEPAGASGGATAGKYTTIPIAKRRYYGRVQQGVHEFLEMGPDVVKGDMTSARIQTFFDPVAVVVVPARNRSISGQCTTKDRDCRGKEIRDSRYNDMKASMYLLGNAFRTDQQKPPDRLPTVKAAKAFFKEMDEMEKKVRKKPKTNDPAAVENYAVALRILDAYLDLVELPPTDSGHYDKEFDTLVGESARIT